MAFTYSPALDTDLSRLRFEIGDTQAAPSGVMPNGDNVPDATISALLTRYTDDVDLAFIGLCQSIGAAWATAVIEHKADGLSVKRGDVSKRWQEMANERGYATGKGAGYSAYLHETAEYSEYAEVTA